MNNSLAARFSSNPRVITDADQLAPIRPYRSLLTGSKFGRVNPFNNPEPPFINESQAIAEDMKEEIPILPAGMSGQGIVETGLRLAGKAGTALKIGKAIAGLATGNVGTTISNKLSERFNKNPEWRPGYKGEAHMVLPTKHGLTRANFCGPGTNLLARLERGDRGVSQVDTACSKHDMLYHLAKTKKDIREADNILIRDIDNTDAGRVQKGILKAGLRAKTLGEDVGLLDVDTFTNLPGLEGRGVRGHHKMMACSLVNRMGMSEGPFARACNIQGSGMVSNPQEATDLSHRKPHDLNISNMSGRGVVSDIAEIIEKPADKLRKSVLKTIRRTRKKAQKARRAKGAGLQLSGAGAVADLAGLAASFITPKIIQAVRGKKGKGATEDFFKGFVTGFTDPVKGISDIGKLFGRGAQRGGSPRDPTIGNLQGRGRISQARKKNPGHDLGKQLLKMHGLSPTKLHKMGITEKHLRPVIRKMINSPAFRKKMQGKGLHASGGEMSGGQFGILASLAASFIVPKIIKAVTDKK